MIRSYVDTDADAVAALSFNRQARDFHVAHDDGLLVGLLTSTLLPAEPGATPVRHIRVVVHPGHRRRGIGARLLAEAARQADADGAVLGANTQASWSDAEPFLRRHGFTTVRTELLMSHGGPPPQADAPAGFTLRPAGRADDAAWIALHADGYLSGGDGHHDDITPLTADDLDAARAAPGFALTVAQQADGSVVGFCHVQLLEPETGLIDSVVVHRDARGKGLGAALTATGVAGLLGNGAQRVELNVLADNLPAIAVYRRLGFVEFDRMLTVRAPRAEGVTRVGSSADRSELGRSGPG